MPLYAERWTARPAWLALPMQKRIDFLDRIGPDMEGLATSGATLIGVVLREFKFLHRTECHYLALWEMPEGGVQALDSVLKKVGWLDYFEPVEPTPLKCTLVAPEEPPIPLPRVLSVDNGTVDM